VVVPFATSRAYLVGNSAGRVEQIIVKSIGVDSIGTSTGEVTQVLDGRHLVSLPSERDFNVLSFTNLLDKSTGSWTS
jgi:hypothetical protein